MSIRLIRSTQLILRGIIEKLIKQSGCLWHPTTTDAYCMPNFLDNIFSVVHSRLICVIATVESPIVVSFVLRRDNTERNPHLSFSLFFSLPIGRKLLNDRLTGTWKFIDRTRHSLLRHFHRVLLLSCSHRFYRRSNGTRLFVRLLPDGSSTCVLVYVGDSMLSATRGRRQ